jgi:hypothetical protein
VGAQCSEIVAIEPAPFTSRERCRQRKAAHALPDAASVDAARRVNAEAQCSEIVVNELAQFAVRE